MDLDAKKATTVNLSPNKYDIAMTRQLESAGKTLGIRLLDHVIFSQNGYYSFQENDC
jgi:DNA repair protein RadC